MVSRVILRYCFTCFTDGCVPILFLRNFRQKRGVRCQWTSRDRLLPIKLLDMGDSDSFEQASAHLGSYMLQGWVQCSQAIHLLRFITNTITLADLDGWAVPAVGLPYAITTIQRRRTKDMRSAWLVSPLNSTKQTYYQRKRRVCSLQYKTYHTWQWHTLHLRYRRRWRCRRVHTESESRQQWWKLSC